MSAIDRSVATLRVAGDELCPDEITRRLGCAPSHSQRKGDLFRSGHVARFGMWRLKATDRQPSDPDAQVAEILNKLTENPEVWRSITSSFRVDIFFGLFMKNVNEGFSLSSQTLSKLGTRGIEIGFDIYGAFPKDEKKDET